MRLGMLGPPGADKPGEPASNCSRVREACCPEKAAHTNRVGVPDWPDDAPPGPEGGSGEGAGARSSPAEIPDPDSVVIPDDLTELEPDIRAYYRELARQRNQAFVHRIFMTRRWERFGLSGPMVVAVLCIVALFGSLASVLVPRVGQRPGSEPLAAPSVPVGRESGLVPAVNVSVYGDVQPIRARRPDVIALVPAPREDCARILSGLYSQAKTEGLRFDIVGAPDRESFLREIDRRTGNGGADVMLDPDDTLATTYGPGVLTILVVAPDGTVAQILRNPQAGEGIEGTLQRLYHSGAAAGTLS